MGSSSSSSATGADSRTLARTSCLGELLGGVLAERDAGGGAAASAGCRGAVLAVAGVLVAPSRGVPRMAPTSVDRLDSCRMVERSVI